MTPTTYGRDFAYCLKSHGGVRGFNASLWRFLLRCTLFCHSVATFLTSVSSYEGGCGFEVLVVIPAICPPAVLLAGYHNVNVGRTSTCIYANMWQYFLIKASKVEI